MSNVRGAITMANHWPARQRCGQKQATPAMAVACWTPRQHEQGHTTCAYLGDGAAEELEAAALAMLHRAVTVGGGRALQEVAAAGREVVLRRAEASAGAGAADRRRQKHQHEEPGRHSGYDLFVDWAAKLFRMRPAGCRATAAEQGGSAFML